MKEIIKKDTIVMADELITFETAKLAKEKGFNLETHDYFSKDSYEKEFSHKIGFNDDYWGDNYIHNWNTNGEPFKPFSKECYSTPTQSLLQKWLREVYSINILTTVHQVNGSNITYDYCLHKPYGSQSKMTSWSQINYESYEEALEIGLQEALKLIN